MLGCEVLLLLLLLPLLLLLAAWVVDPAEAEAEAEVQALAGTWAATGIFGKSVLASRDTVCSTRPGAGAVAGAESSSSCWTASFGVRSQASPSSSTLP